MTEASVTGQGNDGSPQRGRAIKRGKQGGTAGRQSIWICPVLAQHPSGVVRGQFFYTRTPESVERERAAYETFSPSRPAMARQQTVRRTNLRRIRRQTQKEKLS